MGLEEIETVSVCESYKNLVERSTEKIGPGCVGERAWETGSPCVRWEKLTCRA